MSSALSKVEQLFQLGLSGDQIPSGGGDALGGDHEFDRQFLIPRERKAVTPWAIDAPDLLATVADVTRRACDLVSASSPSERRRYVHVE